MVLSRSLVIVIALVSFLLQYAISQNLEDFSNDEFKKSLKIWEDFTEGGIVPEDESDAYKIFQVLAMEYNQFDDSEAEFLSYLKKKVKLSKAVSSGDSEDNSVDDTDDDSVDKKDDESYSIREDIMKYTWRMFHETIFSKQNFGFSPDYDLVSDDTFLDIRMGLEKFWNSNWNNLCLDSSLFTYARGSLNGSYSLNVGGEIRNWFAQEGAFMRIPLTAGLYWNDTDGFSDTLRYRYLACEPSINVLFGDSTFSVRSSLSRLKYQDSLPVIPKSGFSTRSSEDNNGFKPFVSRSIQSLIGVGYEHRLFENENKTLTLKVSLDTQIPGDSLNNISYYTSKGKKEVTSSEDLGWESSSGVSFSF